MQSRVICNSLCGVRVNIMEEQPLMVSGRKITNRIRDKDNGSNQNQQKSNDTQVL